MSLSMDPPAGTTIRNRRGNARRPPDPPGPDDATAPGGDENDDLRRRRSRRGPVPCRAAILASAAALAALLLLAASRRSNVGNVSNFTLPKADVGTVPTNGGRSIPPEREDSEQEAKAARASGDGLSNKHGEGNDRRVEESSKNSKTTHNVNVRGAREEGHGNDRGDSDGVPAPAEDSAASFPPGCHWSCYVGRYKDLSKELEPTEEAARRHYVQTGAGEGRDCRCDREAMRWKLARYKPIFKLEPSDDSLCSTEDLAGYCKNVTCEAHERDVDEKLLDSALGGKSSAPASEEAPECRMLWLAAIHESDDAALTKFYASFYVVALGSALLHAPDSLAPVLLVGRQGTVAENSTEHGPLGRWAEAWGVTVLYSPRLSFHDHPLFRKRHEGQPPSMQGVFLRLDAPRLAKEHRLLERPGICQEYVLSTNLDVIFSNRITPRNVQTLATLTGDGVAMYGRQYPKHANIKNTGVLVMNVDKFVEEVPKMLDHLAHWGEEQYPELAERGWYDQGILNSYQAADDGTRAKFKQLPMHYNWKPYWGLKPSSFSQVKIIHFHGPKPNQLLDEVASCNRMNFFGNKDVSIRRLIPIYRDAFNFGVCCDRGRVADWSIRAFNVISARMRL